MKKMIMTIAFLAACMASLETYAMKKFDNNILEIVNHSDHDVILFVRNTKTPSLFRQSLVIPHDEDHKFTLNQLRGAYLITKNGTYMIGIGHEDAGDKAGLVSIEQFKGTGFEGDTVSSLKNAGIILIEKDDSIKTLSRE